jgi:NAD(P)H-dependent FMN reductase
MKDKDFKVVVILGTTRQQRLSVNAAKLIAEIGNSIEGISTTLVDPNDFNLPGDGNDEEGKDPKYSQITADADAFFIVTPEYNHSFPGSLKRLLDSELGNYNRKAVAIAGVSNGNWGGVRAVESLVPALRQMGLVSISTDLYFPRIQDIFDESGILLNERYLESVPKIYDELIWMIKSLKYGRENF